MSGEGGVEDGLPLREHGWRLTQVDHGRRQHADSGVAMLEVVPGKESLAMGPAVLNAAEAVREVGTVLERPKLTFREGLVVGKLGAAVCFGDAPVRPEKP